MASAASACICPAPRLGRTFALGALASFTASVILLGIRALISKSKP